MHWKFPEPINCANYFQIYLSVCVIGQKTNFSINTRSTFYLSLQFFTIYGRDKLTNICIEVRCFAVCRQPFVLIYRIAGKAPNRIRSSCFCEFFLYRSLGTLKSIPFKNIWQNGFKQKITMKPLPAFTL